MTIVSMLQRHITEEILDFEQYENIAPAEFHTWTGLTQDQFTELLDSLPSLRTKKNKRTVLAAVLVKLRTDMPEFVDFPRMDENELLLFALGVYQLKHAKSYYGEHVLDNGAFTIELSNELSNEDLAELQGNDLWMIRGRLQSRQRETVLCLYYNR
ncbi:unnamed protein product [Parnassius apollo]|uniref:(apollo) hypothetical protein n=1 Tax=Parnassius apollo TaxID=110799 RepID=A0A8S3XKA2_PARAO|nr:unnamed protein product [Parnassius apollo]